MIEDVTVWFEEAQSTAVISKKAEAAKNAETDWLVAKNAEDANANAEAPKKKAEEGMEGTEAANAEKAAVERQKEGQATQKEGQAALEEIKAQEAAKEEKRAALQKKAETGSLVAKNAALNQLAQIDNQDDLQMHRANTKLEAAQRKAAKPLKAATVEAAEA